MAVLSNQEDSLGLDAPHKKEQSLKNAGPRTHPSYPLKSLTTITIHVHPQSMTETEAPSSRGACYDFRAELTSLLAKEELRGVTLEDQGEFHNHIYAYACRQPTPTATPQSQPTPLSPPQSTKQHLPNT